MNKKECHWKVILRLINLRANKCVHKWSKNKTYSNKMQFSYQLQIRINA